MDEKPPIVFKTEASLWAMMAEINPDGRSAKPFDMRRYDLGDDRIYRLSWASTSGGFHDGVGPSNWTPPDETLHYDEKEVSFVNKTTGDLLTLEYLGLEFTHWAPGWCFLLLGRRLHPPVEE